MDIQKEREVFEVLQNPKILQRAEFLMNISAYAVINEYRDDLFTLEWVEELNFGWRMWKAAKAQAVPEGFVLVPEDLAENIALELAKSEFKKSETIFNSAHRDSSVDSRNNLKQKWIEQKTRCILVDYKTLIGKAREQSHD